jgi:putative ABC transport system ATP-binding protein
MDDRYADETFCGNAAVMRESRAQKGVLTHKATQILRKCGTGAAASEVIPCDIARFGRQGKANDMKIELRELKKSFGDRVIFDRFDMTVEPGEMVAIMGKSGSGKTTLLNILGLIEKTDGGQILYDGSDVERTSRKRKLLSETIGFVFQNFGLIDNETVYENLALVKKIRHQNKTTKRASMVRALNTVELDESYLNKKIFECSGGEQQRVAIAKILLKDCDVIFADEPTASLDDDNKLNVLHHLKELHSRGKTIVIVSHDHEVCRFCDRVVAI